MPHLPASREPPGSSTGRQTPNRAQQFREVEKTEVRVWRGKGTGILRTGNQSGEMRELQRERERERKLWSLVDGPVTN